MASAQSQEAHCSRLLYVQPLGTWVCFRLGFSAPFSLHLSGVKPPPKSPLMPFSEISPGQIPGHTHSPERVRSRASIREQWGEWTRAVWAGIVRATSCAPKSGCCSVVLLSGGCRSPPRSLWERLFLLLGTRLLGVMYHCSKTRLLIQEEGEWLWVKFPVLVSIPWFL